MYKGLFRSLTFYLLLIFLAMAMVNYLTTQTQAREDIKYTDFLKYLNEGRVTKALVIGDQAVHGTLQDGTQFKVIIPRDDPSVHTIMRERVADLEYRP